MSADRSIHSKAGAVAGLCVALAIAGQAVAAPASSDARPHSAGPPSSVAPVMPLGEVALPPLGFLDLCERSPSECLDGQTRAPDIAALRAEANRKFWADTFARRAGGPAALGADAGSRAPASRSTAAFDWSRVFRPAGQAASGFASAATPAGPVHARPAPRLVVNSFDAAQTVSAVSAEEAGSTAVDLTAGALIEGEAQAAGDATPARAVSPSVFAARDRKHAAVSARRVFTLDEAGWSLVNQVNRRANRSIRQIADQRQYGVEDYWATPVGSRGRGDCEDYVLAKRRALISAGVPAEALSIAIVETRWGKSHAVLLVASDQGEYVLDNLTPWVSRWDRVNYVWHERQLPGRPFDWVRAAL